MRSTIINLQNTDKWNLQLTIAINVVSSKDDEEEFVMHLDSDNIKFTSFSELNDVIENLFKSLRSKHQENLETSMKGSALFFYSVQLTH